MVSVNKLEGKSFDKRKQVIIEEFEVLGQKKFNINITEQAATIISSIGPSFPLEKFGEWWLKNKAVVTGGQVQEYLATKFLLEVDKTK